MNMENVKHEFGHLWQSISEGWNRLRNSASTALTYFTSGERSKLPSRQEVDDQFYFPSHGWSMLNGDVFEDDKRLIVKLEVPGMEKEEIDIEVVGNQLVVQGEKSFKREDSDGHWHVLQCAYGNFRRVVPLPSQVLPEKAKATYKNGVLRVELPKSKLGRPKTLDIKIN